METLAPLLNNLVPLIVATAIPVIFLYMLYTLDLYGTGSFQTVVACFVWGGISVGAAYQGNTFLFDRGIVSFENLPRYAAPIVEELIKAALLIYLVRRPNFTYFVDGAIYGFAIGIGFAVFENYLYIARNADTALGVAIGRVISTNLMHATASALVGISLGYARFQRRSGRYLFLLFGLIVAIAVHMAFNNLVTRISSELLLVIAAAMGLSGAAAIGWMIKRGLAEEKLWIEETLGETDRVTAGEAAAVQQLGNAQTFLKQISDRFGPEKTTQIERFLTLQARIGILRKTLEKLSDERMKRGAELQLEQLKQEMETARRSVGTYCMLYLRTIFPEDTSPLWGRLELQIQDRLATRTAGGPSLWSAMDRRTQALNEEEDEADAEAEPLTFAVTPLEEPPLASPPPPSSAMWGNVRRAGTETTPDTTPTNGSAASPLWGRPAAAPSATGTAEPSAEATPPAPQAKSLWGASVRPAVESSAEAPTESTPPAPQAKSLWGAPVRPAVESSAETPTEATPPASQAKSLWGAPVRPAVESSAEAPTEATPPAPQAKSLWGAPRTLIESSSAPANEAAPATPTEAAPAVTTPRPPTLAARAPRPTDAEPVAAPPPNTPAPAPLDNFVWDVPNAPRPRKPS